MGLVPDWMVAAGNIVGEVVPGAAQYVDPFLQAGGEGGPAVRMLKVGAVSDATAPAPGPAAPGQVIVPGLGVALPRWALPVGIAGVAAAIVLYFTLRR